ncbi:hypothetical protein Lal_00031933 [Lupinus albus]|nr:hypothetical protein Lal_00031933 [Lupinus albus]
MSLAALSGKLTREEEEKYYAKSIMGDKHLLVKKFNNFLKRNKAGKSRPSNNNETSTSSQAFTCFEYRKSGHMKEDCSTLKKKNIFKWKAKKKQEGERTMHEKIMTQAPINSMEVNRKCTYP